MLVNQCSQWSMAVGGPIKVVRAVSALSTVGHTFPPVIFNDFKSNNFA